MRIRVRLVMIAVACFFSLWAARDAISADYIVDGFALGRAVTSDRAAYASLKCRSSTDYSELTWCTRSVTKNKIGGGTLLAATTLLHSTDGIARYVSISVKPVFVDKSKTEAEIAELSHIYGKPAKVQWLPERAPTSVMASWGDVTLTELSWATIENLKAGHEVLSGVLLDTIGSIDRSRQDGLPIFRYAGKNLGYIYTANFENSTNGYRHYIAIDTSALLEANFRSDVLGLLRRDKALPTSDYSLWSLLAKRTRRDTLDRSYADSQRALNVAYAKIGSSKLASKIWGLVPDGVTDALAPEGGTAKGYYRTIDIYPEDTKYPRIRADLQAFLDSNPNDRFTDIARYIFGQFDEALSSNSYAVTKSVLSYACGHSHLALLLKKATDALERTGRLSKLTSQEAPSKASDAEPTEPLDDVTPGGFSLQDPLSKLLWNEREREPIWLQEEFPPFSDSIEKIKQCLSVTAEDDTHPQADDASFLLGIISVFQKDLARARIYLGKAMSVGNGDYRGQALTTLLTLIGTETRDKQEQIIESDVSLSKSPELWYFVARTAYRLYDYSGVERISRKGLSKLGIADWRMPATTDTETIVSALRRELTPNAEGEEDGWVNINLTELVYLMNASEELLSFANSAKQTTLPELDRKARLLIAKYSFIIDQERESGAQKSAERLRHKDLRQALHLIDLTFDAVGHGEESRQLREWLHYRRIRILAVYHPKEVAAAFANFDHELPGSKLLDDAMVEKLFAEGIQLKDLDKASATFAEMRRRFANANAIDNAYSWMVIVLACNGQLDEAKRLNQDIITRFPVSRHAKNAIERMANGVGATCSSF